jgi:hypothetical protein
MEEGKGLKFAFPALDRKGRKRYPFGLLCIPSRMKGLRSWRVHGWPHGMSSKRMKSMMKTWKAA